MEIDDDFIQEGQASSTGLPDSQLYFLKFLPVEELIERREKLEKQRETLTDPILLEKNLTESGYIIHLISQHVISQSTEENVQMLRTKLKELSLQMRAASEKQQEDLNAQIRRIERQLDFIFLRMDQFNDGRLAIQFRSPL
jgi:hypothetical protein